MNMFGPPKKTEKMNTYIFGLKISPKCKYEYYSVLEKHQIIRHSNIFDPNREGEGGSFAYQKLILQIFIDIEAIFDQETCQNA